MKKKYVMTAAAGIVGSVMLITSCFATYATSSGYTAAKNAAKNLLTQENCTISGEFYIKMDDVKYDCEKIVQKFDKNGLVKHNEFNIDDKGNMTHSIYYQDGLRLQPQDINRDGTLNKLDGVYVRAMYDDEEDYMNNIWLFSASSEEVQKYVRFWELAADMFVGDLKNNVLLTNSDEEGDTYSVSLDMYQIPEIYQAGLDLITEENKSPNYHIDENTTIEDLSEEEYYELLYNEEISFDDVIYSESSVENVNASVKIDKEGRLSNATGEVVISASDRFNKKHTMSIGLNLDVYDYGTTVCDRFSVTETGIEKVRFDSDGNERRIEDIEKEIEKLNKLGDDDDKESLENLKKESERLQQTVDMPEYQRNNEITKALIYDELSDEDRAAYIEERKFVQKELDRKNAFTTNYFQGFEPEIADTEAAEIIG